MFSRLKVPLSLGLSFYGIAYAVVKLYGYNSTSFTVIAYLYIVLAGIIALKYELGKSTGTNSLISSLKSLVVVSEGEELTMRRLLTGEKYKIKGEVEKIQ